MNPLLDFSGLPRFAEIKPEHVAPAIEQLLEENRALIEQVTTRALAGAAGPPGLDELLAMDIGEATAFEDPLGIAMSWEEKYAKKKAAPQVDDPPDAQGDPPPEKGS